MEIVDFYCPDCRARLRLDRNHWAGRAIDCPECRASFRIPTDGSDVLVHSANGHTPLPSVRFAPNGDASEDVAGHHGRNRRSVPVSSGGSGFLLTCVLGCALLVAVIVAGYTLANWWMFRPTAYPPTTVDYLEARHHFSTRLTVETGSPQVWAPIRTPPDVASVSYPSGQLHLKAWVSREAAEERPRPAVLFVHCGYAFDQQDWDDTLPFREAGYIVMTPLLRGENGLSGNFTLLYSEVDDVLAAADTLAAMPGVDPKQIYLAGHSNGGTLALLASMCSRRFLAVASFSGSCDQATWARKNISFQDYQLVPFDKRNMREFQMRSPLAFPRSFKCPVRMYYGDKDEERHLERCCLKTASLAQDAHLDVTTECVPGTQRTALNEEMKRAIVFFKIHETHDKR